MQGDGTEGNFYNTYLDGLIVKQGPRHQDQWVQGKSKRIGCSTVIMQQLFMHDSKFEILKFIQNNSWKFHLDIIPFHFLL